ncbi:hypothetical protein C8R47DRAFT_1215155 [Mycena vitilis]|nr:hypothetical protein C8R47DRAFT_1215155 [Mycena vitilis]
MLDVAYVTGGNTSKARGPCVAKARVSTPLCRVEFITQTSETSAVHGEVWLPDEWDGRFLALGNGGLGGCAPATDWNHLMRWNAMIGVFIDAPNPSSSPALLSSQLRQSGGPASTANGKCLKPPQIEAPLYDDGELLYPCFGFLDGAGDDFNGDFPCYPKVTSPLPQSLRLHTTGLRRVNPAGIGAFEGDMSAFRDPLENFSHTTGAWNHPQIPSGNEE